MNIKTKRFIAYILDALLISIIVAALTSNKYTNPNLEKYNNAYKEYEEILKQYKDKKISEETYQKEYKIYNYKLSKYNIYSIFIQITLLVLYFGVFQLLNNNQTLGKKIMKIKIINHKDANKKLTIWNYIIRVLILNGVFLNIVSLLSLYLFKYDMYYSIGSVIYQLTILIDLVIISMILLSKDGRGLHDVLANTEVISA